jgi:anti-sigma factor RsiW
MTSPDPGRRPRPELLAAYADGELCAAERARVEAWLAAHPEAAVELSAQRRLSRCNCRFWAAAAPPEPVEAAWSRVLNRVEAALAAPAAPRPAAATAAPPAARRWYRPRGVLAAVAAGLALFALPVRPPADGPTEEWAAWAVFPVAAPADVEIESLRQDDAPLLVVGASPLTSLPWATAAEVTLEYLEPDEADGMVPAGPAAGGDDVPMVYTPLARRP